VVGNQYHQFPMVDQVVGQVADLEEVLMEVLVEVLVVDLDEGDRVEVDLGKVDQVDLGKVDLEGVDPEEDHIHPVMGLEQVAQTCGVE
jgi:hypothetical protein